MIDFSIVGVWTAGAIIVVGVIQWLKGFVQQIVRSGVPTWVWSVIMPLCAIGTSRAFDLFGGQAAALKWVWNALGIWAASQLGYEVIVKSVANILFNGRGKNMGASCDEQ